MKLHVLLITATAICLTSAAPVKGPPAIPANSQEEAKEPGPPISQASTQAFQSGPDPRRGSSLHNQENVETGANSGGNRAGAAAALVHSEDAHPDSAYVSAPTSLSASATKYKDYTPPRLLTQNSQNQNSGQKQSKKQEQREERLSFDDVQLNPGDVFNLVTLSDSPQVNNEPVVIYKDNTLGIKEPHSPGYPFQATLMSEYRMLLVPEPLATVKLDFQNVLLVNDSMYRPDPIFEAKNGKLKMDGGHAVVCPSWNSVIVYVNDQGPQPCSDAINVELGIVPVSVEKPQL